MGINEELEKAVRSGELIFGTERSLKALKRGKAKAVIAASNCPEDVFSDLKHYTKIFGVPLHVYEGDGRELGTACGKPFVINVVAVIDQGDSSLLSVVGGE